MWKRVEIVVFAQREDVLSHSFSEVQTSSRSTVLSDFQLTDSPLRNHLFPRGSFTHGFSSDLFVIREHGSYFAKIRYYFAYACSCPVAQNFIPTPLSGIFVQGGCFFTHKKMNFTSEVTFKSETSLSHENQ